MKELMENILCFERLNFCITLKKIKLILILIKLNSFNIINGSRKLNFYFIARSDKGLKCIENNLR
ncbi:hypothetical protein A0O34_12085 [Chryseobacterium glaciei]|uniref:Uncharacterized protein n=1 Tax=Chryseobacterium glaciei TaxID=1685010 RepID=A0A172XW74_9FLAO|nr:hypothetical protein A0O34_12085 [Chryseobacterium glaciei]